MKFFIKWLLPLLLAFTALIEGVHYSFALTNLPSDGTVFGGLALLGLTVALFVSFSTWFVKRIIKANHV